VLRLSWGRRRTKGHVAFGPGELGQKDRRGKAHSPVQQERYGGRFFYFFFSQKIYARIKNLKKNMSGVRHPILEMAMIPETRVPDGFYPIRRRVWNISTRGYINGQHHVPIG
jgi:hypothetical protein